MCSWHIFIIFSSSQFCTSLNQAFHDVIKVCDKCSFFSFLFPLYFGMSVECKLCISKVHRNKATPELAIIFLLKSQLFIFYDQLVNLRSSASVLITTMLTVCYCVGSPARQHLTNFDTLYLLKQLFCMENGFTGYCSIECCKAYSSVRLSKVNIQCLTSSTGVGLREIVVSKNSTNLHFL